MSFAGCGVLTSVLCTTLAAVHLVSCNHSLYTCCSALLPLGVVYMFSHLASCDCWRMHIKQA